MKPELLTLSLRDDGAHASNGLADNLAVKKVVVRKK